KGALFRRVRQSPVQKQVGDLLDAGARRQILDRISRDGESSAFAVHLAQLRGRGDDAFKTVRHVSMFKLPRYIVNIDLIINIFMPDRRYYLSAAEAASLLGVS